jgi:predicted O-methyltransferase YrrM
MSPTAGQSLQVPNADNYREFYMSLKDSHIPITKETGRLLYMLTRSSAACSIVEFGTSFGISTLHLAAGLKDNGGGLVITTEFEPSKVAKARAIFRSAGLSDLIEIREGDALDTLARNLPPRVDLLLLDGAKPLYVNVLQLVQPHFHVGSLVVADNADINPEYLAVVRAARSGYVSTSVGPDVELSLRV